jgi:hypothetical protein
MDNCIPITDEEYFEDDIVGRFVEFISTVYGDETLEENLDFIKSEVEKTLLENGCDKSVTAESVSMLFPIKRYENFTMPAGVYDALRITIGNGEGKNWWCVMFPPLCYGACINDKDVEAVIGDNGVGLMEKSVKYEVRFKIVEWFKKMFDKGNMWFTNVLHKTYISVDEKGTEAAAVTAIHMAGSALPPQPIELKFNKPFYFVIRDNISGETLFMGRYAYAG